MEKTIIVRFTKQTWKTPIIHGLSKEADLVFNILEAKVLPRQEAYVIMNLEGTEEEYAKGIAYLKSANVLIEEVTDTIERDEDSLSTAVPVWPCAPRAPFSWIALKRRSPWRRTSVWPAVTASRSARCSV